jgi:hypothetical protein
MNPSGDVISPLVHQDDLRHYGSNDTSKFYHNRKMTTLKGVDDVDDAQASGEESDSREGGVVTTSSPNPSL